MQDAELDKFPESMEVVDESQFVQPLVEKVEGSEESSSYCSSSEDDKDKNVAQGEKSIDTLTSFSSDIEN